MDLCLVLAWKPFVFQGFCMYQTYERSVSEFKEYFQYGKLFYVKKIEEFKSRECLAVVSRIYLLKNNDSEIDKTRIMSSTKKMRISGFPSDFFVRKGDLVFESEEDGSRSILRKK